MPSECSGVRCREIRVRLWMRRGEQSTRCVASCAVMAPDPRDGTFRVPPNARPDRLDRVLKSLRPDLSWGAVRELIARGKVSAGGVVLGDPGAKVGEGAELTIRMA